MISVIKIRGIATFYINVHFCWGLKLAEREAFSSTVKDPRQASGSKGPHTESHGPHTGHLLAPYNPAD